MNIVEKTIIIAYENNLPVRIIYQANNNISDRLIRITEYNGEKLTAHCYLRNEKRTFYINKILSAVIERGILTKKVERG